MARVCEGLKTQLDASRSELSQVAGGQLAAVQGMQEHEQLAAKEFAAAKAEVMELKSKAGQQKAEISREAARIKEERAEMDAINKDLRHQSNDAEASVTYRTRRV